MQHAPGVPAARRRIERYTSSVGREWFSKRKPSPCLEGSTGRAWRSCWALERRLRAPAPTLPAEAPSCTALSSPAAPAPGAIRCHHRASLRTLLASAPSPPYRRHAAAAEVTPRSRGCVSATAARHWARSAGHAAQDGHECRHRGSHAAISAMFLARDMACLGCQIGQWRQRAAARRPLAPSSPAAR